MTVTVLGQPDGRWGEWGVPLPLASPGFGRSEECWFPDEIEPAGRLDVVVAEGAVPALVAAAHPASLVRHRGEHTVAGLRVLVPGSAPSEARERERECVCVRVCARERNASREREREEG